MSTCETQSTETREATTAPEEQARPAVSTRPIEFPAVSGEQVTGSQVALSRFYDMTVSVSVELGCVELPIGELLRLGEGSIIELERGVDEPVDILAQGVPLARGDVVAVNGRYAVRITEVVSPDAGTDRSTRSKNVRGFAPPPVAPATT